MMFLIQRVKNYKIFLIFTFWLVFPQPCFANAGLPMLVVLWPPLLLTLIPIIFIEAWIIKKYLPLTYKKAARISAYTNSLSTLIGIPITWLILTLIEIVTTGGRSYAMDTWKGKFITAVLQAPWLIPYENEFYVGLVATCVLTLFFFLSSWLIEAFLSYYFLKKEYPYDQVSKALFRANLGSYLFTIIFTISGIILFYHI